MADKPENDTPKPDNPDEKEADFEGTRRFNPEATRRFNAEGTRRFDASAFEEAVSEPPPESPSAANPPEGGGVFSTQRIFLNEEPAGTPEPPFEHTEEGSGVYSEEMSEDTAEFALSPAPVEEDTGDFASTADESQEEAPEGADLPTTENEQPEVLEPAAAVSEAAVARAEHAEQERLSATMRAPDLAILPEMDSGTLPYEVEAEPAPQPYSLRPKVIEPSTDSFVNVQEKLKSRSRLWIWATAGGSLGIAAGVLLFLI